MAEFESWLQYREFSQYIMNTARHVRNAKNTRFIDTVLETSRKRIEEIARGTSASLLKICPVFSSAFTGPPRTGRERLTVWA
jgi:hypothetical protein